jgi:DNA repair protein RecO (recombination protein O)
MHTQADGRIWRAITYFSLWATRLSGVLPDLREQPKLSGDSREIAGEMLRSRIGDLPERRWSKDTANDLRRFLVRQMEAHVERRFLTVPVIEAM